MLKNCLLPWGFVMASQSPLRDRDLMLPDNLRYLSDEIWQAAQVFSADMAKVPAEVNSIQSHALVGYYLDGWAAWFE